jgi:tRNA (adenine37-N6)-methyltransferase
LYPDIKNYNAILKIIGVVKKANETSEIEIFPEYLRGLNAIEDYDKIMVLFWMYLQDDEQGHTRLTTSRHREKKEGYRGVFATDSPYRPNPIGVTVVYLLKVEDCRLFVKGLDAFEGTPIIDIKSA